jgi:riboflavin biosynthesis pyrimidine reductase
LTLVRLLPSFEVFDGLSTDDQSWLIAKEYGICNGWRINFAVNDAGNSYGDTGKSADVTSDLDRLLLGKLRSLADVIVTSGRTARVEKYRSSKHAPIAIFTITGELDSVPAIQGTQYFTPLVLTPQSEVSRVDVALSDVDVRILAYRGEKLSNEWPFSVAEVIHGEGYQSPILESGQSTISEFIASGVIDEICLSITSSNSSGLSAGDLSVAKLTHVFGSLDGFQLEQLFTDGRTSFSRWRRGSHAT